MSEQREDGGHIAGQKWLPPVERGAEEFPLVS
jgi:hypothetical protein